MPLRWLTTRWGQRRQRPAVSALSACGSTACRVVGGLIVLPSHLAATQDLPTGMGLLSSAISLSAVSPAQELKLGETAQLAVNRLGQWASDSKRSAPRVGCSAPPGVSYPPVTPWVPLVGRQEPWAVRPIPHCPKCSAVRQLCRRCKPMVSWWSAQHTRPRPTAHQ